MGLQNGNEPLPCRFKPRVALLFQGSGRHRHLIRRIHGLSGDGHEGLTTTVMLEDGDGDDAFAHSIFRKSPRQSCPRTLLEPWPIVDQRYPRRPQRRENG